MDNRIERANKRRMEEIERWLDDEEAAYSVAEVAIESGEGDGPYPVRGFRCNWDTVKQSWATGETDVSVLVLNDQAIGFLWGTDILEIRPDMRGRGFGRILAEFMLKRGCAEGRSLIEIDIAPRSAFRFWTKHMGFTEVAGRTGPGGGIYAYKVLQRKFALGGGDRVTFSISFYSSEERYREQGKPFAIFSGKGERLEDGTVQLPERAFCFNPEDRQHIDYFVKIELDKDTLLFDKAKYDTSKDLGVRRDKGGIFYIEGIRAPSSE